MVQKTSAQTQVLLFHRDPQTETRKLPLNKESAPSLSQHAVKEKLGT